MSLDSDRVRQEFPALSRRLGGKPVVYLDSAATSLKPSSVLEAESGFYRAGGANVHRGKHALSEEASEAYERAREAVADHLGAPSPKQVAFVPNTTYALNLIASGIGLSPDDEVIAAPTEHHSNLVPWMRRATVRWAETAPDAPVSRDTVAKLLGPKTRAVVIGHGSNVSGVIQPVAELCALAREAGVVSVVDAAQSAPHVEIDVAALDCDFLAFSGHKALAPMGTGALYGKSDRLDRLEPLCVGGGTVDRVGRDGYVLRRAPQRLEAGTPNVGGAIALAEALGFLRRLGFSEIAAHGEQLAQAFERGLADVRGVRAVMARKAPRLPIVSLLLDGVSVAPDDLSMMLSDRYGIMTRSGFHCAHPLFDGAGWKTGALRASCHVYTTEAEVEGFCRAVAELTRSFAR